MSGVKFDKNQNLFQLCKPRNDTFVLDMGDNQDLYDARKAFAIDSERKASNYILPINADGVLGSFIHAILGIQRKVEAIMIGIKRMIMADEYKDKPLQVLAEELVWIKFEAIVSSKRLLTAITMVSQMF